MNVLQSALLENSKKIDIFFDSHLPNTINIHKKLIEAMRYSTIGLGKKMRGFLVIETGEMLLKTNSIKFSETLKKELIVVASAVEALHSYSLIHDDLPAMDNSALRRGKKSTHIKFGEATAILAGDALQSWAFQLISDLNLISDPRKSVDILFNLSKSIGMFGMAGGQQAEIDSKINETSANDVQWIQQKKTGCLIKCCANLGAIIGMGSMKQKNSLLNYAENLGLAFQITDDILDLKGDSLKIGKPIKQDSFNETPNFVTLLGEEQAKKKSKEIIEKAIDSIKFFGKNAKNLVLLARYVIEREF